MGSIVMGADWRPFLWMGPAGGSYHGTEVRISERRPVHLAFIAPSKMAVEEFHWIGLKNCGKDNGTPLISGMVPSELI